MPLLPELAQMLERIDAVQPQEAPPPSAAARAAIHAQIDAQQAHAIEPSPEVPQRDYQVAVDDGEVVVRMYTPRPGRPLPCHVYIHGGGWWMGTLNQSGAACRRIAANVGCAVASVDHRLAPEHPFPGPAEDCYAALEWVDAHASELGVDPTRISVGGRSSGANLAAAVALMVRDRGGPRLVAQLLEIPALDLTMSQPSIEENATGYMLTRDRYVVELDAYCPVELRTHPYASPALAQDLTNLPPAFITTAEYDPVRDDGHLYARRLRDAGVSATARCWPGHFHGSSGMTAFVATARDWQYTNEAFLRDRLAADQRTHEFAAPVAERLT